MNIHFMSDTHNRHEFINFEENIDIVIHCGDAGVNKIPEINEGEIYDFIKWYKDYPAKYKIFIPGNHDTSIQHGLVHYDDFEDNDIILLNNKLITIEEINIFGSPYTPKFGTGWAYNMDRDKIYNVWETIPENTDILVTHGPPKGILDLTSNINSQSLLTHVGCKALYERILEIKPKFHAFGHIHNENVTKNAGIFKSSEKECPTTFINASILDIEYNYVNNGIIINYETNKI